jgi:hypothetical protein
MQFHDRTRLGAAKAKIRRQVEDLQRLLIQLEAMTASSPSTTSTTSTTKQRKQGFPSGTPTSASTLRNRGIGQAALEVLRQAGRPMHGLREVLPIIEQQGFHVRSRSGFATLLVRTGQVVRVAPGTFAFRGLKGGAG